MNERPVSVKRIAAFSVSQLSKGRIDSYSQSAHIRIYIIRGPAYAKHMPVVRIIAAVTDDALTDVSGPHLIQRIITPPYPPEAQRQTHIYKQMSHYKQ